MAPWQSLSENKGGLSLIFGVVLSLVSSLLFIITDVMKEFRPVYPATPIAIFATAALTCATPLLHYAGYLHYPSYPLLQPFDGPSTAFLLLQFSGWTLYSSGVLCAIVCSYNLSVIKADGLLAGVAVLGFGSALIVLASQRNFEETRVNQTTNRAKRAMSHLWPERMISFSISLVALLLCGLVDYYRNHPTFPTQVTLAVAVMGYAMSAGFTHIVIGPKISPKYQVWQPFAGGTMYVLLQAASWLLLSALMATALVAVWHLDQLPFDGLVFVCGLGGVISQALLMISLPRFDDSALALVPPSPSPNRSMRWPGEALLSVIMCMAGLSLLVLVDGLRIYLSLKVSTLLPLLWTAAIALYLSSPVAHMAGKQLHLNYKLWQPFEGGPRFVFLHAIAWTVYAVSLMVLVLYLANSAPWVGASVIGSFGASSHVLILLALPYFLFREDDQAQPHSGLSSQPKTPPGRVGMFKSGKRKDSWMFTCMLSGDQLVVGFLVVASLLLFLILEFMKDSEDELPARWVQITAGLGYIMAGPITHCIGGPIAHSGFKVFQPFQGGVNFVWLQATGWTLYALFLLASGVVIINPVNSMPSGTYAIIGGLGFVGQLALLVSIAHFEGGSHSSLSRHTAGKNTSPPIPAILASSPLPAWSSDVSGEAEDVDELERLLQQAQRPDVKRLLAIALATAKGRSTANIANATMTATTSALSTTTVDAEKFPAIDEPDATNRGSGSQSKINLSIPSSPLPSSSSSAPSTGMPKFQQVTAAFLALASMCCFIVMDYTRESAAIRAHSAVFFAVCATLGMCLSPLLVHCFTGPEMYPGRYHLWMPFVGGAPFVLLQSLGWTLVSTSVFLFSPMCLYIGIGEIKIDGLLSSVGSTSFAGQILLLISLNYFEPESKILHPDTTTTTTATITTTSTSSSSLSSNTQNSNLNSTGQGAHSLPGAVAELDELDEELDEALRPDKDSYVSLLLVIGALFLFALVDVLFGYGYHSFPALPLVICATLGILGGLLVTYMYALRSKEAMDDRIASAKTKLRFDARRFVLLQFLGWTLFCLAVMLAVISVYSVLQRARVGWLLSLTGVVAVVSHIVIVISFRPTPGRVGAGEAEEESFFATLKRSPKEAWLDVRAATVAFLLYTMHLQVFAMYMILMLWTRTHGAFFSIAFLFTRPFVMPWMSAILTALYVGFCLVAVWRGSSRFEQTLDVVWLIAGFSYSLLYYTTDHQTGKRTSQRFRDATWAFDSIERYFNFTLIGDGKLETGRPYMFAFHPHGIYPNTLVWGPLASKWRQRYPGIIPVPHVASIIMLAPGIRDLAMMFGMREVTRASLTGALSRGQSVILVPGGQAEMRLSRSRHPEIGLVAHHHGFLRLALQHGAALVPTFCFGETELFDNVYLPSMQGWTTRVLGFGYPHFPYGKWYLPLPRRNKLTMVVGEPIEVPICEKPTAEDIQALHGKYFGALQELFDKHKTAAGYPNHRLKFLEPKKSTRS